MGEHLSESGHFCSGNFNGGLVWRKVELRQCLLIYNSTATYLDGALFREVKVCARDAVCLQLWQERRWNLHDRIARREIERRRRGRMDHRITLHDIGTDVGNVDVRTSAARIA